MLHVKVEGASLHSSFAKDFNYPPGVCRARCKRYTWSGLIEKLGCTEYVGHVEQVWESHSQDAMINYAYQNRRTGWLLLVDVPLFAMHSWNSITNRWRTHELQFGIGNLPPSSISWQGRRMCLVVGDGPKVSSRCAANDMSDG